MFEDKQRLCRTGSSRKKKRALVSKKKGCLLSNIRYREVLLLFEAQFFLPFVSLKESCELRHENNTLIERVCAAVEIFTALKRSRVLPFSRNCRALLQHWASVQLKQRVQNKTRTAGVLSLTVSLTFQS